MTELPTGDDVGLRFIACLLYPNACRRRQSRAAGEWASGWWNRATPVGEREAGGDATSKTGVSDAEPATPIPRLPSGDDVDLMFSAPLTKGFEIAARCPTSRAAGR